MAKGVIFASEDGRFVQMCKSGSFSSKATVVAYVDQLNDATFFANEKIARWEVPGLKGHLALQAEEVRTLRLVYSGKTTED